MGAFKVCFKDKGLQIRCPISRVLLAIQTQLDAFRDCRLSPLPDVEASILRFDGLLRQY